jgi:hypothetical protein
LEIEVSARNAPIREASLVAFEQQSRVGSYEIASQRKDNKTLIHLKLATQSGPDGTGPKAVAPVGKPAELRLTFQRAPYIDIFRIASGSADKFGTGECPQVDLVGGNLARAALSSDAKLMRWSLIQERISDWCRAANETVGNIVISLMVISALWLAGILSRSLWRLFAQSDDALRRISRDAIDNAPVELRDQGALVVLHADYERMYRRLAFARTVGPACGFALTVLALIAALHPSVQAERDAFQFVSSLQVAMTATLVGLVIRIVAEFAIRIERECLFRVVALAATPQSASPP